MSTRVDVEEIEVTRGEYVLAFVLAVFLLVGGLWAYFQLDDLTGEPPFREPVSALAAPERAALNRRAAAERRAAAARHRVDARHDALIDSREAYRTALDEGRQDAGLERRYQAAQARYAAARALSRRRSAEARRARAAARPVETKLARLERAEEKRADDALRRDKLLTAGLRLVLVLVLLGRVAVDRGPAAPSEIALGGRRLRGRRGRGRARAGDGRRLPDRLVRSGRPGSARPVALGRRGDALRARRAPAPPRPAAAWPAREAWRVPVLRLPHRPGRPLRRLRPGRRRVVRAL